MKITTHAPITDSIPGSLDAYTDAMNETDDLTTERDQDALFESMERRNEELDDMVATGELSPYDRRAYVPGARRGLLS